MNMSQRGVEGTRMEQVFGPFTIEQAICYGFGHKAGRMDDAAALASMRSRLAVVIRIMMRFDVTRDMPSVEQLELAGYVPGREEAYGYTAAQLFRIDLDTARDGLLSWIAGHLDARGATALLNRRPCRSRQDSRTLAAGVGGAKLPPH